MTTTRRRSTAADLVHCGLFAALIAAGAFIKIMIPLGVYEVTFSLQFLFSLLAGLLLGARSGLMSVLTYLIIGLVGVPVFAHGGGPAYLLRPTFGFLIGFAAAAWIAGKLREIFGRPVFPKLLFACFLGEMAYYACGLIYYYFMFNYVLTNGTTIGLKELFLVWFLSTVVPDFILCVLAAALACRLIPLLESGRM
ncbi:MAG: biotin transporter BioY [Stomatobaculum sp.]|nr:biotin transporter BioY [Stomatobaculum sp.]